MGVKVLKSVEEFQAAIKSPGVSLVDFYADWCGPCKYIGPKLEQISNTVTNIQFYKVNIDNVPNAAPDVQSIPTFRFYQNGKVFDEVVGADENTLRARIDTHKNKQ